MHAGLADHIVNKGHVIGTGTERRNGLAQHAAALTIGLELPHRFLPGPEAVLEGLHLFAEVSVFTVVLDQRGFVIKQVDVAGSAAHEKLHHAFRLWHKDLGAMRRLHAGQRMKRERAKALSGGLQKLAAGEHGRTVDDHTPLASPALSRNRARSGGKRIAQSRYRAKTLW